MPKQITVDLEDVIRKELAGLDERLRQPSMDDRPTIANITHARAEALRWVLRESGVRI